MLEKNYDAAAVEPRIAEIWEAANAFAAGAGARPGAEPFTIVIPPPNVTGSLHMGHALNNTLQDILVRFERMRGKDVLWQPGMDHAGIATQMVVERQLAERQQPDRHAMGREKFVERIWEWKAESGGMIFNQLKRLGASCDWSRERFTMDEGLSQAVIEVFVRLYNEGLIYKDKRLVNWDPKLLTAISDLEVEQVEVKGNLWHFRYPLADGVTYEHPYVEDVEGNRRDWRPSDGEPSGHETRDYLVVATTRPETMLGDTGVAVHPDDPRYAGLVGKDVILPMVGRRIPIVADEYPDMEAGTGAVKMTPAHDFNDFDVGKRQHLRAVNIMTVDGRLTLKDNDDFLEGVPVEGKLLEVLEELDGMERFAARAAVVEKMDELGLLAGRRAAHAHGSAWRPRRRADRAVPDRPVVCRTPRNWPSRQSPAFARAARKFVPEELGKHLFPVDGEHPALVHLAPAVVGAPDPGLVRAGRHDLRREGRGGGAFARPSSTTSRMKARGRPGSRSGWRTSRRAIS